MSRIRGTLLPRPTYKPTTRRSVVRNPSRILAGHTCRSGWRRGQRQAALQPGFGLSAGFASFSISWTTALGFRAHVHERGQAVGGVHLGLDDRAVEADDRAGGAEIISAR